LSVQRIDPLSTSAECLRHDQEAWINGAIAAGVPAGYAVMLRWLTGAIIAGDGSVPTGDIETVTGRPPASFEAFARRNAAAWTAPEDK
jgi:hypothetical protein